MVYLTTVDNAGYPYEVHSSLPPHSQKPNSVQVVTLSPPWCDQNQSATSLINETGKVHTKPSMEGFPASFLAGHFHIWTCGKYPITTKGRWMKTKPPHEGWPSINRERFGFWCNHSLTAELTNGRADQHWHCIRHLAKIFSLRVRHLWHLLHEVLLDPYLKLASFCKHNTMCRQFFTTVFSTKPWVSKAQSFFPFYL